MPKLKYNDKYHAYWYDGDRCKGVTTVAGIPDNTYSLDQWTKRQVALGMALGGKPFVDRALAHFDDRAELDKLAEDAMRQAKSDEAADRGTAIHRVLERHDLGQELIDTPESKAMRAAYDKALDAAGLDIVPEYIERIVVYPKHLIAGRFDRLFKRRRDGKLVIGDIKSGSNAVKYPHKTAVQLALYANAPLLAGPIPSSGGETEDFDKLPTVDTKWGYVVHAPDEDHVEVVKIDIAAGYKAFTSAIVPTLAWRNADKLVTPVGAASVTELLGPATPERVDWIRGRLQLAGMVGDSAKRLVAERWPPEVPVPGGGSWSERDVDALDAMLHTVERDVSLPFPANNPARSANGIG